MNQKSNKWLVAVLVTFGALIGARSANANGRYPAAQQLLVDPGNPNKLWLRATYGVLTSEDSGRSWAWICESAIGYGPREDPLLAVTSDGKVFAGAAQGLLGTSDSGCSWSRNPDIGTVNAVDIALERDQKHLLVLAQVPNDNYFDLIVYRSDSETHAFEKVGQPIASDLLGHTIDPAPSDPKRIYVTGAVIDVALSEGVEASEANQGPPNGPAVLLRSGNGGESWTRLLIPGASLRQPAFIAAVHPTNPDVLYVRVQGAKNADGFVESFLLYTDDAGDTWREIFRGPADLLGFALSPDGTRVSVGLGDTVDVQRPADRSALGIYRADTTTFAFERVFSGQVGCLNETGDRLFVCGNQASEGFELGVSTDQGKTVAKLLSLGEVGGTLSCPSQTPTKQLCSAEWTNACPVIGKCSSSTGAPDPAGSAGSPSSEGPSDGNNATDDSSGCSVGPVGTAPHGWPTPFAQLAIGGAVGLALRAVRRRWRDGPARRAR